MRESSHWVSPVGRVVASERRGQHPRDRAAPPMHFVVVRHVGSGRCEDPDSESIRPEEPLTLGAPAIPPAERWPRKEGHSGGGDTEREFVEAHHPEDGKPPDEDVPDGSCGIRSGGAAEPI